MNYTNNLNLKKPGYSDPADIQDINDNMDIIDQQINNLDAEKIARTITVGVGKDFTTIQAAIDSIKKHIKGAITIQVDEGTYNENLYITDFYGDGNIIIKGATSLTDTHRISQMFISNCGNVSISGFKMTSSGYHDVEARVVGNLYMQDIKTDVVSSFNGFQILNSLATIVNCQISNKYSALYAAQLSIVVSRDWVAGAGNAVGITSNYGSTVAKVGIQPQGTAAEAVFNGGVIR